MKLKNGAAVLTLAVSTYVVGWPATKQQLHLTNIKTQTVVWPVAAPFFSFIAPHPSRAERDIWRTIVADYSFRPNAPPIAIGVDRIARWKTERDETPRGVYERLVDGWPNQPGVPDASAAVQDFLIRNARPTPVRCDLPPGSRFVPRAALQKFTGRFAWEDFSGTYGVDAYLSLSRVGFDVLGRRAVVYVEISCGGLCGHGTYYVLVRRQGRWVVEREFLRWIA
jgi:hypothetical protein